MPNPRSDIPAAVETINALFRSVTRHYKSRISRRVMGFDVTLGSMQFLRALGRADGSNVGEIALELGVTSSTISVLAKKLERKGLVRRRRVASDERRVRLELSPAARRMLASLPPMLQPGLLSSALARLSRAERTGLLNGLRRLDELANGSSAAPERSSRSGAALRRR
jgi:DNA-binding MarR family transcriptional regulator